MGGDALTKIEETGGGRGLRESSWTPDHLRVNQVALGPSEKEGSESIGDVWAQQ